MSRQDHRRFYRSGRHGERPVALHGRPRSAFANLSSCRNLAEELCSSLAPQFEAQGIKIVSDISSEHIDPADREMIRRAVLICSSTRWTPCPTAARFACAGENARRRGTEVADSGPGSPTMSPPRFRAVLHHQAGRNRPWAFDRLSHRRSPRRQRLREKSAPKAVLSLACDSPVPLGGCRMKNNSNRSCFLHPYRPRAGGR